MKILMIRIDVSSKIPDFDLADFFIPNPTWSGTYSQAAELCFANGKAGLAAITNKTVMAAFSAIVPATSPHLFVGVSRM
jgi:hypothetical protein